ncbi:MAG: DNA ligase D [Acidobacteriota bacterium]
MPGPDDPTRLATYRAKRTADATPEPFGGAPAAGDGPLRLFVVQKHDARRLHYDFRLEFDGVLWSWAVPKGPSTDPREKRLAVEVEDHPVEYADYEGVIPEGNYGAGPVILWDKGTWKALEDPVTGMKKGKLLFELSGYKMRGEWTLVRTKAKGGQERSKEWLLIKHTDAWAAPEGTRPFPEESVHSGLTIDEMREGPARLAAMRRNLATWGAASRTVRAADVKIMLAEGRDRPFSEPGWFFEIKYDGYRVLCGKEEGKPVMRYRRGMDVVSTFPEIASALAALPVDHVVLDGEIVVLDESFRPSFNRLQRRALLSRPMDVRRAAIELPATLYLFDILGFEGWDLRKLCLARRKEALRALLPRSGPLRYSDHVEEQGKAFYAEIEKLGLEGMVGKKADAPYQAGRSASWLKVRVDRTGDFVIVGTSPPEGARNGFGALYLAVYEGKELIYAGKVGSGFGEKDLERVPKLLDPDRRKTPPCVGAPKERGAAWVEPRYVCEVRYKEWVEGLHVRQPVFLRLRDDKAPEECTREAAQVSAPVAAPPPRPAPSAMPEAERRVAFTNRSKVFWPEQGYTKGDLIDYYEGVSPWLMPYLKDRPVVLTRYPDGIAGKSFFQKDAPSFAPDWIRTERTWSEHAQREIDYFVCDDVPSLLFLINMGTIPLHIWSSRMRTLATPDWCILDLDPKGAPFAHVVQVAQATRALCDEIGLPTFPKTSGSTGLHVLVPLGCRCTYAESRGLGELLARVIVKRLPDIATIVRAVGSRGGRVYIDFLQNGRGRLLAGPFSVRPLPGAPVSTPVTWDEVRDSLDPRQFTIKTAIPRFEKVGDPLAPVLTLKPDLHGALVRLGEAM